MSRNKYVASYLTILLMASFIVLVSFSCSKQSSKAESSIVRLADASSSVETGSKLNNPGDTTTVQKNVGSQTIQNSSATKNKENISGKKGNVLPPKAQFVSTVIDAGEVEQGEDIKGTFILKNTGPGVLKILSAKPT